MALVNVFKFMPTIKKIAPKDIVEAVERIETQADRCYTSLSILKIPANVASCALLAGGIQMVEREIAKRGDNTSHLTATLINTGRFLAVALKWVRMYGKRASRLWSLRWNKQIEASVKQALTVAHNYDVFLTCLPLWHKDRYAVEVASQTWARFTVPGTERNRQVAAYQKGFRPKCGRHKGHRAEKTPQTPRMEELFASVFQGCRKTGGRSFRYADPWELWKELLPEYQARVDGIVRRSGSLVIGDYSLTEFKLFYASFLAVCAAHEFLCFAWGKNYGWYPLDSALLIRSRSNWATTLARLSGIPRNKIDSILRDLTFDPASSLDLHIHPFVPLDNAGFQLAVAPQFPLHSRPDENILRVCSLLRPSVFDATSLEKEPEMLSVVQKVCARFKPCGPISLPAPVPDIDLLLEDESCSTVAFVEAKWIRKTARSVEHVARDAEVLKGVGQLTQIATFLSENPSYLVSRGILSRPIANYQNVFYVLLARDHWLWIEPTDAMGVVEFEAFVRIIAESIDLKSAVEEFFRYNWLPQEGRDFTVQHDRATANGVTIESEVFYPV
ncbi:MAG: hypothetical protein ABR866_00550 [Candidatus Korobacteraceae bacterium]